MLLASHLYTAVSLQDFIHPRDKGVYYLCSILPDIRYPAAIKRTKTHVPPRGLSKYLDDKSDAYKGYSLHLLIDTSMGKWKFYDKVRSFYPPLLRPLLRKSVINIIVELYCLEQLHSYLPLSISQRYDKRFQQFGISEPAFNEFVKSVQTALLDGTIEGMMGIVLSSEKLKTNRKVRRYMVLARIVLRNKHIYSYLTKRVVPTYRHFLEELREQIKK